MKVYLDENLPPRVAAMLRERGIDATSARHAGNASLDDRTQLRHAAGEGRAIVTADIEDFVELDAETIVANASHAGIILLPARFPAKAFGALAAAIEEIVRRYPGGIPNTVLFLGRGPAVG